MFKPNKCLVEKYFAPRIFLVEKNDDPKISFGPKILSKNFWIKIIFGPKVFWGKNYLGWKKITVRKSFGQQNFGSVIFWKQKICV